MEQFRVNRKKELIRISEKASAEQIDWLVKLGVAREAAVKLNREQAATEITHRMDKARRKAGKRGSLSWFGR